MTRQAVPVLVVLALLVLAAFGGPTSLVAAGAPPDQTPDGIETTYGDADVQRTSGGGGVDVAVLDTGVDVDHPDLRGRVELCRDFTADAGENGTCVDRNGHGTMVAGVAVADAGPEGRGLYGVAPDADLYAFKVCSDLGSCRTDDIALGIYEAVDAGAEVVVLSVGGQATPHVQDAVAYAAERGTLVVAAAGNDGPALGSIDYPAADATVVAVGSVERTASGAVRPENYRVTPTSSRGDNASEFAERDGLVEFVAPGQGVLSTVPGGGYEVRSGTSFAAPHVAGLAAKLWPATVDADGDGTRADDVRQALQQRARAFDVTEGSFAREGYDPAAGLGVPSVRPPSARAVAPPSLPLSPVGSGSSRPLNPPWSPLALVPSVSAPGPARGPVSGVASVAEFPTTARAPVAGAPGTEGQA